jgi:hypothetical protein
MRDASESHGDGGVTAWNETGADERMTREQIAEAQRMSREWLEAHPSPLRGTQPHLATVALAALRSLVQ